MFEKTLNQQSPTFQWCYLVNTVDVWLYLSKSCTIFLILNENGIHRCHLTLIFGLQGFSCSLIAITLRSLCHPKMVLLRFSCSTTYVQHSQYLLCICSSILLNVEGQVQYQHLYIFWQENHNNVKIHYQCHLCSSSIALKHFQSFDMSCICLGCIFADSSHQWLDRFQSVENDEEWQNLLEWSRCRKQPLCCCFNVSVRGPFLILLIF